MKLNLAVAILSVLLALDLCVTGFLCVKMYQDHAAKDGYTVHYTVYVGTNDKDTYEQIIPTDEVKSILDGICAKYVEGYTIHDAVGGWVDETGTFAHENTVICYLDDIPQETMYAIADEMRAALNQNTILIQTEMTHLDFYAGQDGNN